MIREKPQRRRQPFRQAKKRVKTAEMPVERRRKLNENRAQMRAEQIGAPYKRSPRPLDAPQPPDVRDDQVRLERKDKRRRDQTRPAAIGGIGGHVVIGVIDFSGLEAAGVETQPLFIRQNRRVKTPPSNCGTHREVIVLADRLKQVPGMIEFFRNLQIGSA